MHIEYRLVENDSEKISTYASFRYNFQNLLLGRDLLVHALFLCHTRSSFDRFLRLSILRTILRAVDFDTDPGNIVIIIIYAFNTPATVY